MAARGRIVRQTEAAALRLMQADRATLVVISKSAFASAAAFELARVTAGSKVPALAAMAGIITVQVSGSQNVRRALEYSAGVAAGVIVAIVLTRFLGLHWWSLALLVLMSLVAGRIIRLGSQANQIAISALLVMSLGSSYGWTRIIDTLIGSAVGVATNLAVPAPSLERTIRRQIASAATELTLALRAMSTGVRDGWSANDARGALGTARAVSRLLVEPRASVETARDERRLSLPGRLTANALRMEGCDAAVTALDHATNEVRTVGRNLLTMAVEDDPISEPERVALSELLGNLADLVDAWRTAVVADDRAGALDRLRAAVDRVTATRTRVLGEPTPTAGEPLWVATLLEVERITGELDPAGTHATAVAA